ncbi:MAG: Peptidyl-prolyl cis-trans isomerase pin4 [Phylliscum demangeonii]|nr:MAG: Peptidyl-prolyl cis-trans isomerase pin4 [Phylliscum demangeonii]
MAGKPKADAKANANKNKSSTTGKDKDKSKSKSNAGTSAPDEGAGNGAGASKLKAATSINVRHILCEKHSKKEEAIAQLRAGVKFDDVARQFSEDKARQGGSLGWKLRGSLEASFEKAAFELEPSTTANPIYVEVKTGFGYHVVMVEGRK